jgi:glucan phosphoethanolaminetransferase (alkaline phosphatase superfamily)
MNKAQSIVLAVAACNLAVMLLFPPYDSIALGRGGAETFDAFYFAFDTHFNKLVNSSLLLLEVYWLVINAAIAWLLLRSRGAALPIMRRRTAVSLIVAANLGVVFLFPPFENYASMLRSGGTHFDSFYFAFGDKSQRPFYIPLLYMEVLWVLVNGAVMWLLLRDPVRAEEQAEEE